MTKRIRHMGMTVTRSAHEGFHAKAPVLSPKQHAAMMKRMGVTEEQDEAWHRTHATLAEQRVKGLKQVNPFAVGGGFMAWCVEQGWLVQQRREYFATEDGVRQLRERFGISL
jgi:hypothetical protein